MLYAQMGCLHAVLGIARSVVWRRVRLIRRLAGGEAGSKDDLRWPDLPPVRVGHGWGATPAQGLLLNRGLEWALDPWTRMSSDLDTGW